MHNKFGNPLGSTWQWQTKATVKNIKNSNGMKAHIIPFLSCYLISFHYIYSVYVNVLILDILHNNFYTKVPKSSPHKIVFSRRIIALLNFTRVKISVR